MAILDEMRPETRERCDWRREAVARLEEQFSITTFFDCNQELRFARVHRYASSSTSSWGTNTLTMASKMAFKEESVFI
jgi:hypothetical protein